MSLPEPTLLANLRALAARDRSLAERLTWPVADDHVRMDGDGRTLWRAHRAWAPLDLDPQLLERAGRLGRGHERLLLLGIGSGDLLRPLLDSGVQLVVHERDPYLLRLALERADLSHELASGRLRLSLGADLPRRLEELHRAPCPRLDHPFLGEAYRIERGLLDAVARGGSVPDRWALLATGTLFVDDLAAALGAEGLAALPVDVDGWSAEELDHCVAQVRPELLARVNLRSGLAEFCEARRLPLLIWEVDPATDRPLPVARPVPGTRVFTYRRGNVAVHRAAGFEHVEYLPLAADVERRRPLAYDEAQRTRYQAPVSFVGASLVDSGEALAAHLERTLAELGHGGPRVEAMLAQVLEEQAMEPSRHRLPELLRARLGPELAALEASAPEVDWVVHLAELAASRRRLDLVAALAPFGVQVWGDPGWRRLEPLGVRHRGHAGHREELTRVYGATQVNVDIGRLYQTDIVTMRVFDVLACGGFLVAERSEALGELFREGLELEAWSTREELVDKVAWYLERPDAARRIAERGRARVRTDHTVRARVRHMLGHLASPFAGGSGEGSSAGGSRA